MFYFLVTVFFFLLFRQQAFHHVMKSSMDCVYLSQTIDNILHLDMKLITCTHAFNRITATKAACSEAAVISRGRETRVEQVALNSFISRWSILSMVSSMVKLSGDQSKRKWQKTDNFNGRYPQ